MADISTYLAAILSAVYGEDVRGSIHDAIEIINDVSEVVLSTGTAVTSASSSSTGFYEDSLYLNTDTYELWKCVGTDTWQSLGILKGSTGDPGEDGNRWYRGTGISGKAVNPTVYSGSGITDANPNDFYLNPVEGAVYHCVTGGDAATATWSYDFTMTGGGGGGSVVTWTQIQASGTEIATIDIDGSTQSVYAPSGGGSYTASKGVKLSGSDIQADLKSSTAGSLAADSKGSTASREYAVGLDSNNKLSVNIPWTDTQPNDATLTITQNSASQGTFTANANANATIDIVTDQWVGGGTPTTATVSSGSFTFSGLDDTKGYGYDPYFQVTSASSEKNPTAQISSISNSGTANMSITYTTNADNGTSVKMRIIK